ncbi:MAG TPA: hypothetical protein VIM11_25600 [Tepidisphaeraceae bacterium]
MATEAKQIGLRGAVWVLAVAASILPTGCAASRPSPYTGHVSREVLKRWAREHSYYALLEIVEAEIKPEIGTVRREDIRKLLGEPDATYPHSGTSAWVYPSERFVPMQSYLLLLFDDRGVVTGYDWLSE